ncbi:MAG TPA: hypothetical protein VEW46_05730 [Pyrinomonadaceae bacterium]|nr:hypothetical protein [Pyrinomonadaceae bacterium]
MNQDSLRAQLDAELRALRRLRERLLELRYFFDWEKEGTTLYYAVDFSEIFSYLHRDEEDDRKVIGVSLDQQNSESNALHYRLALTHLFNSFAKPLYILPSHVLEMWSYVKTAGIRIGKKPGYEEQPNQLIEGIRSLPNEVKSLLNSLGDKTQSLAASQQLLNFVKSAEFGPLCVDVSEFVAWHKRGNVLNNLIRQGRLSPRISNLLLVNNIDPSLLPEPSHEEITKIVRIFETLHAGRPPFATNVDARAFLVLRNLNQILAQAGIRIILITRDTQLLRVVNTLAEERWFQWDEARRCVRGIESIFIDLTLTSTTSLDSKRKWVTESERKLGLMYESVQLTLNRMKTDTSVQSFAAMGERVLKDTTQLWDQHINIKLSLASKAIPWLGKAFLDISKEDLPETFKPFRAEYQILQNLVEYLSTNTYRDLAVEDVKNIWRGIETDCLRIGFLNLLGEEGAKKVSRILTQTFTTPSGISKTILHSRRFLRMPSLQLVSKTYQGKLKALRTQDKEQFEKMLVSLITEVVSGFDEPEDLLVMAFLLGLLEEWSHSLEVIMKCRQIVSKQSKSWLAGRIIPSEIDYLSSAVNRRLAQLAEGDEKALGFYLQAYKDSQRARMAMPEDPRYLTSEAANAMMYRETIRMVSLAHKDTTWTDKYDILVLDEAKVNNQFIMALGLAKRMEDVRLTIIILNNLAFMEALADSPKLQDAEHYIKQIDEAMLKASEEEQLLFSGVVTHINETKLMLRARRAREAAESDVLRDCIKELALMLNLTDLLEAEKKTFAYHLEIVNRWLEEIEPGANTA